MVTDLTCGGSFVLCCFRQNCLCCKHRVNIDNKTNNNTPNLLFTKALSIGWANDHPQKQLEIVHNQYDAVFIALPLAVCIALLPTQALDGLGTVPSVMNSFDFRLGEISSSQSSSQGDNTWSWYENNMSKSVIFRNWCAWLIILAPSCILLLKEQFTTLCFAC